MLARVLKGEVVFGQLLGFERLVKACLAEGTESESLLLYLDEAHLAEGVATVQVAWDSVIAVEVFVARGALHAIISKLCPFLLRFKLNYFSY